MQQGYTITPDGYEDQVTGQMVFTDYKVVGSAPGEEARTNEVVEHQGRFLDNEDGSTTYVNEATDEDYSNILSSYGGEEVIADAEDWAQRHFSQDEIDYYNQVLERGDLNEIQEAVDLFGTPTKLATKTLNLPKRKWHLPLKMSSGSTTT